MGADEILLIKDISMEESEDLPAILAPLVQEAAEVMLPRPSTPSKQPPAGRGDPADAVAADANRQMLMQAIRDATPLIDKFTVRMPARGDAVDWMLVF